MCLAIYKPEGNDISVENLHRGWLSNNDGAGYCFVDEQGDIVINKFMTWGEFLSAYQRDVAIYGNTSPFLIHFRITSKGVTTIDNCHPFRVNDDMAIIHNGTMSNIPISKGDTRSDTKIFAEEYLPNIGEALIDNVYIFELAKGFVGYSKVCILHRTRGVFIINEELGHWNTEDGCWYSNKSYEPKKYETHTTTTKTYPITTYDRNTGWSKTYDSSRKVETHCITADNWWDWKPEDKVVTRHRCDWCDNKDNDMTTAVTTYHDAYTIDLCTSCLEEYASMYEDVLCQSCERSVMTAEYIEVTTNECVTLCKDCADAMDGYEGVHLEQLN